MTLAANGSVGVARNPERVPFIISVPVRGPVTSPADISVVERNLVPPDIKYS